MMFPGNMLAKYFQDSSSRSKTSTWTCKELWETGDLDLQVMLPAGIPTVLPAGTYRFL